MVKLVMELIIGSNVVTCCNTNKHCCNTLPTIVYQQNHDLMFTLKQAVGVSSLPTKQLLDYWEGAWDLEP